MAINDPGFFSPLGNLLQIIEKRRRDRINSSLSELRRLVPTAFEKQVSVSLIPTFLPIWAICLIIITARTKEVVKLGGKTIFANIQEPWGGQSQSRMCFG